MLNFRNTVRKMFGYPPASRRARSRSSGSGRPQGAWVSIFERLEDRFYLSAVGFFSLGDGFTATDQGYNTETQMTYIVGQQLDPGNEDDAMLLRSNNLVDWQSDELVGLGGPVIVDGIAADGSRLAGSTLLTPSQFEGTTWMSATPDAPMGIGFIGGAEPSSVSIGAWQGGVVGDHNGLLDAVYWTADTGLIALPDGGGLSQAIDVSADGAVMVGSSTAGPAYWDADGFYLLPNPYDSLGRGIAVSPDAKYIGGDVEFLVFTPVVDAGRQATLWTHDGSDYQVTPLTWADGSRVKGLVADVSNSGYAVIALTEGGAAVYHEDIGVMTMADFVALHGDGVELPNPNDVPVAIADVGDGVVQIACESMIIVVDMNEDGPVIIEGTNGNDRITERVGAGEFVRILAGNGNDNITVFIDGPGAKVEILGGKGNDRITVYTWADDADVFVTGDDGNDTLNSYVFASGVSFYAELGNGNDRGNSYVSGATGASLFFDLGDGRNRMNSRVFYSEDVSVGIVGGDGNMNVSNLVYASSGFTQATVLGDGNHRVTNRTLFSDNGMNAVYVGAGRSNVTDYLYRSEDVYGVYVLEDGASRFTGIAIFSDNVTQEVFKVSERARARGFGILSTDYVFSLLGDRDELFMDPFDILDFTLEDFGD